MATYKEIRGVNIQSRDVDPTAVEGDVWYNATTGKLKVFASAGAWSTGNNQNVTANNRAGAKGGTQTAHLVFASIIFGLQFYILLQNFLTENKLKINDLQT